MRRGKSLQFARSISLFLAIVDFTLSAPPNTPCPQLFQYKFVDNKWVGVIKLKDVKVNQTVSTVVGLTLSTFLPSSYVGSIDFLESDQKAVQSVAQGKPVTLKINFPVQEPIPRVTEIVANSVVLCNGPPDRTPQTSKFQLYHIFNPNEIGSQNRFESEKPTPQTPIISTTSLVLSTEVCGQQLNASKQDVPIKQFVINGEPTNIGEWPWLVAIFVTNGPANPIFQCGGTLLTSKVTITASHCLFREGLNKPMSPNEVIVAFGRYMLQNWSEPGSLYSYGERIEFPPDYIKTNSFAMDIGAIVHSTSVNFANHPSIRPICFWSGAERIAEIEGLMGTVVGWGEDELGNKPSPVPKKVNIPIVSRQICIRGSTQLEVFTGSANFCAGQKDGRGPCHGDSGSGLIIYNNNRWELRGIVGGTVKSGVVDTKILCNLDEYVVYVDVLSFKRWIRKLMTI